MLDSLKIRVGKRQQVKVGVNIVGHAAYSAVKLEIAFTGGFELAAEFGDGEAWVGHTLDCGHE